MPDPHQLHRMTANLLHLQTLIAQHPEHSSQLPS